MTTTQQPLQQILRRYYAFSFFRHFAFFSAVLVPFFTDWGRISFTQIQILQSWFMLCFFLLEVPTGAIADYFGRKYSLSLGALITAGAALLYGSVPQFWGFMLAEFMFAMGMALTSGADQALLYDSLKEIGKTAESVKAFGKAHSFHLAGILVSALLGSFIAGKFGLNAPMLLSSVTMIIACAIAWSMREPQRSENISESRRYLDIARKGFTYFFTHRTLRLIALDAVIVASAAYFVIWLYQPLLQRLHVPLVLFGFIHAALVGVEIVIAAHFARLEKWFGSRKSLLKFTALATTASFVLVGVYPSLVTVTLFIIFAGGFGLTRMELMAAHMQRFMPSENRATVLSSISMLRRFALVLLNPLVGFTADHSLTLALIGVGILPLLVFFIPTVTHETEHATA